jgi:DNA-binding winged helix-turn-helix (wHTH) protein
MKCTLVFPSVGVSLFLIATHPKQGYTLDGKNSDLE